MTVKQFLSATAAAAAFFFLLAVVVCAEPARRHHQHQERAPNIPGRIAPAPVEYMRTFRRDGSGHVVEHWQPMVRPYSATCRTGCNEGHSPEIQALLKSSSTSDNHRAELCGVLPTFVEQRACLGR